MSWRARLSGGLWVGVVLAVVTTLIWAGNFVVARGLRHDVPPVALSFWRWTVAAAVLAPVAARSALADLPAIRRHLGYLCALGVLGVAAFNTLLYLAGHSTSAVNLSLLAAAAPIWILVLARIFDKERLTWRRFLGLALAVAGVGVLITEGSLSTLTSLSAHSGDLIMLSATLTFASYSFLIRHKPNEIRATSLLFTTILIGLAALLPAYLIQTALGHTFTLDVRTIVGIGYVGVFASAVAWTAWNRAIAILGPARTGFLYYLVPVFTAVEAALLLGERVHAAQVASMGMVIAGILIANLSPNRPGRLRRPRRAPWRG